LKSFNQKIKNLENYSLEEYLKYYIRKKKKARRRGKKIKNQTMTKSMKLKK